MLTAPANTRSRALNVTLPHVTGIHGDGGTCSLHIQIATVAVIGTQENRSGVYLNASAAGVTHQDCSAVVTRGKSGNIQLIDNPVDCSAANFKGSFAVHIDSDVT
jgi:hypothetical protein